jgi:putative kinase
MDDVKFPEQVTVTDQVVDCTAMSDTKKAFVVDFTRHIIAFFKERGLKRSTIGIAGPSGSGKSFLSVLAAEIGKQLTEDIDIVPVSIDAFHFPNNYLESTIKDGTTLKEVKGRYDTYDVPALISRLEEFKAGARVHFPIYSRVLHEPVADSIAITHDKPTLLIIEGLWLLYDKGGWGNVRPFLDKTYYIDDTEAESRERTLKRHMMGGRAPEDAEWHYEESDLKNRALVVRTKLIADGVLVWPK